MRLLIVIVGVFLLSGCATAPYYKYISDKEKLVFEDKKLDQDNEYKTKQQALDREYKDKQLNVEVKKVEIDREYKNRQLDNEKLIKEKELANTLEIERYKIEQDTKLKEKEMQMEKEKYEF